MSEILPIEIRLNIKGQFEVWKDVIGGKRAGHFFRRKKTFNSYKKAKTYAFKIGNKVLFMNEYVEK